MPVLAIVSAILQLGPQIPTVVAAAKNVIDLFHSQGQISVEQQNALKSHVDSQAAMALSGVLGPEFQVQADPK